MKYLLVFISVLFIHTNASVANKIDSLKNLLEKEMIDTNKVNHLIRLAQLEYKNNPENAFKSTKEAIQISTENIFFKGELISGEEIQLNVNATNNIGNSVPNPDLVFCSDNIMVATVDENGLISASGEGTATIKVCSGSYAETTITVKVTLM